MPRLIDTGSLLEHQLRHVLVVIEAPAEVEARELADHLDEALVRRLVEAVELLDLLDAHRVHALAAAVARPARRPAPRRRPRSPGNCATICSTGPPGTNWITTNVMSRTPNRVGIISSRRFRT
jgi:hypothetical protein